MKPLSTATVFLALTAAICPGAWIPIENIYVQPTQPTSTDPITLFASGRAGYPVRSVTSYPEPILAAPGVLEWNLELEPGSSTVVSAWSTSVQLDPLPANDYVLTVRTWGPSFPVLADEQQFSFTVIPEPAAGLFGMFTVCAAVRRRRG